MQFGVDDLGSGVKLLSDVGLMVVAVRGLVVGWEGCLMVTEMCSIGLGYGVI